MADNKEEAEKRALEKLLREYQANSGMAGFVCSKPVELMPEPEQERLINGFCTSGNLKILLESREKLVLATGLDLDSAEKFKVDIAIAVLEGLIEAFGEFTESKIDQDALRQKVRGVLDRPIPEDQDDLINSLSHMIETVHFLADQPLESKDDWDRMVDCVQMHDALKRTVKVCAALQITMTEGGQIATRSEAIGRTLALASENIDHLEAFIKQDLSTAELQGHFVSLAGELTELWGGG